MDNPSEVTLMYATTRRELATWYWRAWKERLWKVHVAFLVTLLAVAGPIAGHWPPLMADLTRAAVIGAAAMLFLFLFPQIKFKSEVRTLICDKTGIRTTIGKRSGSVSWQEIESIKGFDGTIVISRKNINAFLVPRRAFKSEQERAGVLSAIQAWMHQPANDDRH